MDSSAIAVAAPAKLNLYLHVLGRRDDGFHELDSLVAFARVGDEIAVAPAPDLSLDVVGPFAGSLPAGPDNLVLRAAAALRDAAGIGHGAAITLTKNLPVAAGIGGGSADAAAAIKALARFWDIHPATHDLSGLALGLGADVPVCLFGRAAFMGGIGEQLEPAPALPETALVIVNPGVAVATPAVFGARRGPFSESMRFDRAPDDAAGLAALLKDRRNDLTEPAMEIAAEVGGVLGALENTAGCLLARMSGSGATCFGLYADDATAAAATERLRGAHPAWWIAASRLGP